MRLVRTCFREPDGTTLAQTAPRDALCAPAGSALPNQSARAEAAIFFSATRIVKVAETRENARRKEKQLRGRSY